MGSKKLKDMDKYEFLRWLLDADSRTTKATNFLGLALTTYAISLVPEAPVDLKWACLIGSFLFIILMFFQIILGVAEQFEIRAKRQQQT